MLNELRGRERERVMVLDRLQVWMGLRIYHDRFALS
jgi:hypothetical protein